jgi:dTDP-4-dehydrorhamnose reductase
MKVLVIGSSGMAGHIIAKYLEEKNYIVDTAARKDSKFYINVEDTKTTNNFLNEIKNDYDYIINCVGLLVKDSISRPDRAAIINSWFPHAIEHAVVDSKTKLIHLSTDCVFNGKKGEYVETDIHDEMNAYGSSKSLGEIDNNKDITFRMSIIGTEIKENGTGLLHWFLNQSGTDVPGWDNAWWNGITTLQLAKCIDQYMQSPTISGVYHLVNNKNKINKYELLIKFNEIFNTNKNIIRTQGPKPVNKILKDTRCEFDFEILDYDTQLRDLKTYVIG